MLDAATISSPYGQGFFFFFGGGGVRLGIVVCCIIRKGAGLYVV